MFKTKLSTSETLEIVSRVVLVLLYFFLLVNHGNVFLEKHKISSLLYVIMEAMLIGLVVCRKPALHFSVSPFDWAVTLLATLLPLLVMPTSEPDNALILALHSLGILVTMAGVMSLNRSFGLVPAEREIKVGGMYKIIRHPLYAGYLISSIAVLINHYTPYNLIIISLATAIQVVRILREEKFLMRSETYVQLMKTTRWRLIPFVW